MLFALFFKNLLLILCTQADDRIILLNDDVPSFAIHISTLIADQTNQVVKKSDFNVKKEFFFSDYYYN